MYFFQNKANYFIFTSRAPLYQICPMQFSEIPEVNKFYSMGTSSAEPGPSPPPRSRSRVQSGSCFEG